MNLKFILVYVALYAALLLTDGNPLVASCLSLTIILRLTLESWRKNKRDENSFDLLELMKSTSTFANRGISADSVLARSLEGRKIDPKTTKKLLLASANGLALESALSKSLRGSFIDRPLLQAFSNVLKNGKYSVRDMSSLFSILNENRSLKLHEDQERKELYFRMFILSIINSVSTSFLASFAPLLSVKILASSEMSLSSFELVASLMFFSLSLTLVTSNVLKDFWLRKTLIYNIIAYLMSYLLFKGIFMMAVGGRL